MSGCDSSLTTEQPCRTARRLLGCPSGLTKRRRGTADAPKVLAVLTRGVRRFLGWALVIVTAVAVLAFAIWLVPVLLTGYPSDGLTAAARLTAENNARTPVIAALAVVGAAALTARVTWRATKSTLMGQELDRRRQELDSQGQLTDRYSKAIDQLGSDKVDVRTGGIYALERIATDSARDQPTVMAVLTAFIREHSGELWSASEYEDVNDFLLDPPIRPDVEAAVTVIARRDHTQDRREGISLAGAHLAYAKLAAAYLADADLSHTDLTRANLSGANLRGANLLAAQLVQSDLNNAVLNNAVLISTNLSGANLSVADLADADLTDAFLSGASLNGANFTGAYLTRADFSGAYLNDADFTNAALSGVVLTGAHLNGATYPEGKPIPEGWTREIGSGRLRKATETSDNTSPLDA